MFKLKGLTTSKVTPIYNGFPPALRERLGVEIDALAAKHGVEPINGHAYSGMRISGSGEQGNWYPLEIILLLLLENAELRDDKV